MKKFSIIKKMCSAVTAVAMLASLGTVALAANPGAYIPSDNSVKITDIACTPSDTVASLYNVTVKCELGSGAVDNNSIGVTMLTYAQKDTSLSATSAAYDPYDSSSMQIVGIDQKVREDGVNTVEFTFAVTTDDANGTNAYSVQPGKSAVIMVSGDGLNPAAGLLTIEKILPAKTATGAGLTYTGEAVDIYSYSDNAAILAAVKAAFVATSADVKEGDVVIGSVEVTAEDITSIVKKADNIYTATATIPADATVTSEEYNVTLPTAGLTVTFDVATNTIAWGADTVTIGKTVYMFYGDQKEAATLAEEITNKVLAESINISLNGTSGAEYTLAAAEKVNVVVASSTPIAGSADVDDIEYTVTVGEGAYGNVATVPAGGISTTVKVSYKVTTPAEPWNVTSVALVGTVTKSYTGEAGASKQSIIDDVLLDLKGNTGLTAKVIGAKGEEEIWNVDDTSWTYVRDEAGKCVFAATIVKPAGALANNVSSLKLEVPIEIIVTAPAALKGDVDGNGSIAAYDLTLLVNHLAGTQEITDATSMYAADIDGNGSIAAYDLTLLVNHLAGTQEITQK